jgi:hypothetical protein
LADFRAHHEALTVERDAHASEATRLASDLSLLAMAQEQTQRALDAERLRAEQVGDERSRAQVESIAQRQRAEQAESRIAVLERDHDLLERDHDLLQRDHNLLHRDHNLLQHDRNLLQGSLRLFLRGYLPLLRRHLLGQRP